MRAIRSGDARTIVWAHNMDVMKDHSRLQTTRRRFATPMMASLLAKQP
jgi:hypothetical protein